MVSATKEMVAYCFDTLLAHYNSEEPPAPAFDEGQQYSLSPPLFVSISQPYHNYACICIDFISLIKLTISRNCDDGMVFIDFKFFLKFFFLIVR